MNTATPVIEPAQEYRASMQQAALTFLERHQAEHLGDDALLFTRAVRHLTTSLEVPLYMAETLVGLAYGDLRSSGQRLRLDLAASSENTATITDPSSGMTYAVPVALIVQHLINTPTRRRLRAVN